MHAYLAHSSSKRELPEGSPIGLWEVLLPKGDVKVELDESLKRVRSSIVDNFEYYIAIDAIWLHK